VGIGILEEGHQDSLVVGHRGNLEEELRDNLGEELRGNQVLLGNLEEVLIVEDSLLGRQHLGKASRPGDRLQAFTKDNQMVGPAYKVVAEGSLEGPADKGIHPSKLRAFEELPFKVAFVEDSQSLVEAYNPEDIVRA
jgi:hypothetical protein